MNRWVLVPCYCTHNLGQGWIISKKQKVLTYVKYRAVSGVFQNIDPPPPLPLASVPYPRTKGGGLHTRRAVRGWRVNWKTPDIGLASYRIIPLRLKSKIMAWRGSIGRQLGDSKKIKKFTVIFLILAFWVL